MTPLKLTSQNQEEILKKAVFLVSIGVPPVLPLELVPRFKGLLEDSGLGIAKYDFITNKLIPTKDISFYVIDPVTATALIKIEKDTGKQSRIYVSRELHDELTKPFRTV